MMSESLITVVLYSVGSLAAFIFFYSISKKISGPHLTGWKFYSFFLFLILWGGNQLSVARYGYMLLPLPSQDFFETGEVVRWIAFISSLFQVLCIPTKEKPRRWFSRK